MQATFDPGALVPVPGEGMYHASGTFEAEWGRVVVESGGALVSEDWRMLRLPAHGVEIDPASSVAQGPGWRLQLADGWELVRTYEVWEAVKR